VELKIRFDDFTTKIRRRTLAQATDLTESFSAAALSMLKAFDADKRRIRLLGVGVSQLCPSDQVQMELFGFEERVKRKKMHEAVDRLKEKYGERIVTKALTRESRDQTGKVEPQETQKIIHKTVNTKAQSQKKQ
jgi:DNA polymerase-4